MNPKIDPNQPAYPSGESYKTTDLVGNVMKHSKCPYHPGLTVRAHFAAMAMQGLLSDCNFDRVIDSGEYLGIPEYKLVAFRAVQMADALIAELNKEEAK